MASRNLDVQDLLVQVQRTWLSSLEGEKVLPEVVALTQRLLRADEVSLLLVDSGGKELVEHAMLSRTRTTDDRFRIRIRAEGVTGWVAAKRKSLVVPDVRKDSRYVHTSPKIRSEIAVPIVSGERLLGVLNAESRKVGHFGREEIRLMELLAGPIAIALVNMEAYYREHRRGQQLLILHHVARISFGAIPPVAFLHRVTDAVRREFRCAYAAVFRGDYEAQRIELLAHSSDRELEIRLGESLSFGQGLIGTAFRLGETLNVRDVAREPLYVAKVPEIRSEICVPIRVGERCLGIVDAQSREADAFGEGDVIFLETMARLLPPTIDSFVAGSRARA